MTWRKTQLSVTLPDGEEQPVHLDRSIRRTFTFGAEQAFVTSTAEITSLEGGVEWSDPIATAPAIPENSVLVEVGPYPDVPLGTYEVAVTFVRGDDEPWTRTLGIEYVR